MGHLILKHEMVKKNVIALLHCSRLQIDWLIRKILRGTNSAEGNSIGHFLLLNE